MVPQRSKKITEPIIEVLGNEVVRKPIQGLACCVRIGRGTVRESFRNPFGECQLKIGLDPGVQLLIGSLRIVAEKRNKFYWIKERPFAPLSLQVDLVLEAFQSLASFVRPRGAGVQLQVALPVIDGLVVEKKTFRSDGTVESCDLISRIFREDLSEQVDRPAV